MTKGNLPMTPITSALRVSVATDADTTARALRDVDPFAPATAALHALGLADHVTRTATGIRWRPDGSGGHIDVDADVRVDDECLTIVTRFSASDDATHERLLRAWPVVGPLAATLVKRAANAVKHRAEDDEWRSMPRRAAGPALPLAAAG
jgi:hypothetical protein